MTAFTVFVDESGCEGFTFRDAPEKGSSEWFVLSALITRTDAQRELIGLGASLRSKLRLEGKALIHWTDLSHERRVAVYEGLAQTNYVSVSVVIDKREISETSTLRKGRSRLYFYAMRMLLERVSWYCRDNAVVGGGAAAHVIVEHRRRLKHSDLVDYIERLRMLGSEDRWLARSQSDIRIDWSVIDPSGLESAQKHQYIGLQFADMVASGVRSAMEQNIYGNREHRYAKMISSICYKVKGRSASYGIKFFPDMPPAHVPNMHWFAKYYQK